jgi:hypothetical protein
MWAIPTKLKSTNEYYLRSMREPKGQPSTDEARPDAADGEPIAHTSQIWLEVKARLQLYTVAFLSLLATFSITPVIWMLNRFNFGTFDFVKVFINYVSVVKLYNQKTRSGGSPLDAFGMPPRFFIRQRMIRTIFDVASSGYDRWYILAHSLGSVVAFNALMEPNKVLPNYLDSKRWEKIKTNWPKVLYDTEIDIAAQQRTPPRPAWVDRTLAVSRQTLFANFKGLLTYGSPLDKFATLWPARVPLNKEEKVFRHDVEWINVYDATDPVGAHLDYFDPEAPGPGCIRPVNLCYKASPVILLSHIRYLRIHPKRHSELADLTVEWLVSGQPFPVPSTQNSAWLNNSKEATAGRRAFAYLLQLPIMAVILFGLGLWVIHSVLPLILPKSLGSGLERLGPGWQAAMLFAAALVTPLIFGVVRWLVVPPDEDSLEYREALNVKIANRVAGLAKTVSSAIGAKAKPKGGSVQ